MGNDRAYGCEHLDRLGFVRRCRALGFTLDEIRELLGLGAQGDRDCGEVDLVARDHLAAVQEKIADPQRLAGELRRLSS